MMSCFIVTQDNVKHVKYYIGLDSTIIRWEDSFNSNKHPLLHESTSPQHPHHLRHLRADILRANEDALQVGPRTLHLQPDGNDGVGDRQSVLPRRHLIQEVGHVLGWHKVLKLHLVVLQDLHQLFIHAQQRHLCPLVGLILKVPPCGESAHAVVSNAAGTWEKEKMKKTEDAETPCWTFKNSESLLSL